MLKTVSLLTALALSAVPLVAGTAAAVPVPQDVVQAKASLRAPDLTPLQDPVAVQPDVAYPAAEGTRIEVYSSVGDNDGGVDWRQINQYAYLVSSVPKGKQLHSTIYNTLWDGDKAQRNPLTGEWEMFNAAGDPKIDGMYSPTKAFQAQINQYLRNGENPNDYIHILGSRSTIRDAVAAGSGLASLLTQALQVEYCSKGFGACLSTTTDEELMHAKYAAFEQAKDSTGRLWNNVTWITSANLNGASGGRKSNLSIAVFGDAKAYDGIVKTIYQAEITETFTEAFKAAMSKGIAATNPNLTLYPSPRTAVLNGAAPDHEANFLASQLQAVKPGTKTGCKAYAVHSLFSEARKAVLDNLAKLQTEGCSVKIVLGTNALSDIVDTYFSMSTSLRQLIDRVEFGNVHDKTLSLSYTLNGNTVGYAFGGSANFNGTSLRYDELSFRANDLTLARAVEQQSERLYLLAKGGGAVTPVTGVTITPSAPTIAQGRTLKLRSWVAPSTASVKSVTWSSTDESIATVSSNGTVTGVREGQATIQALSVSGAQMATAVVTVGPPGSISTNPDTTAGPNVKVTNPPVLSMPVYQPRPADGGRTTVVVTWGQGDVDIRGSVSLQYYSGGSWRTYSTFSTNSSGRAEKQFTFGASHTWRVRANSVAAPSGATLTSSAKYSRGYSLISVKTLPASTRPKLYAPNLVSSGGTVPFLIVWKGKGALQLQYDAGRSWKTKAVYTFATGNQMQVGVIVLKPHRWRVVTARGTSSSSVLVTAR